MAKPFKARPVWIPKFAIDSLQTGSLANVGQKNSTPQH